MSTAYCVLSYNVLVERWQCFNGDGYIDLKAAFDSVYWTAQWYLLWVRQISARIIFFLFCPVPCSVGELGTVLPLSSERGTETRMYSWSVTFQHTYDMWIRQLCTKVIKEHLLAMLGQWLSYAGEVILTKSLRLWLFLSGHCTRQRRY